MGIEKLTSLPQLKEQLKRHDRMYVLVYRAGSEQSECALQNLKSMDGKYPDLKKFGVDVSDTRDIHPEYRLTSVPAILEFYRGEMRNVYKGCHDASYLKVVFEKISYSDLPEGEKQKSVTVYTTPTCSWCNTLKTYLRQHKIRFREVDVSRDEAAVREMTNRSGQQGVPQTLIDGEIIVGFDRERINKLLQIEAVN